MSWRDTDLDIPFLHSMRSPSGTQIINWKCIITSLENAASVPNLDPVPRGFRLIDTEEKCILLAPSGPFEYACLSYVWGDVKAYQATSRNISRLEKPSSLSNSKVPATIQDAMAVCQILSIRYLWVDRLCILQDDDDLNGDKQAQIQDMGRIYNCAFVTLAAMEGDASFGLCGVSKALRKAPHRSNGVDNYYHFLRGTSTEMIRSSRWAQRGWTFQEAVLSRRLLVFTPLGLFVEYERARPHERAPPLQEDFDMRMPMPGPDVKDYEGSIGLYWDEPMYHGTISYGVALEDYTRRELGNDNDILTAFQGVCSQFHDNRHEFGMPLVGFHNATLWFSEDSKSRRRCRKGDSIFPSWSWISTKGRITVPPAFHNVHVASWVFFSKANGKVSMVFPRPQHYMFRVHYVCEEEDIRASSSAYGSAKLALEGNFVLETPECLGELDNGELDDENFPLGRRWPSSTDLWKTLQGYDRNKQPLFLDKIPNEQRQLAASPGRVVLYSQSIRLSVTPRNEEGPTRVQTRWDVYGGYQVGYFLFDDKEFQEEIQQEEMPLQFVALTMIDSLTIRTWYDTCLSIEEELEYPFGFSFGENFLAVIAVETRDDGLSRRVGFGVISYDYWVKLQPPKCSFVLE
ncbi:heterokaryon incompatibility protein-domain-containing protein [Phyllosticta capitalensis]